MPTDGWKSAPDSVRRAIKGNLPPTVQAVSVEYSQRAIEIHFYANATLPPDVIEELDADVVTQVIADYPNPDRGDPKVAFDVRLVDPTPNVIVAGELVFGTVPQAI